jgi:hypothetical protein
VLNGPPTGARTTTGTDYTPAPIEQQENVESVGPAQKPRRLFQVFRAIGVEEGVERAGLCVRVGKFDLDEVLARGPEVDLADLLLDHGGSFTVSNFSMRSPKTVPSAQPEVRTFFFSFSS